MFEFGEEVSVNRVYLLAEIINRHSIDPKGLHTGISLCRCGAPWLVEHPFISALAVLDYNLAHDEHRMDSRNLPECCVANVENNYRDRLISALKAEAYKSLEAGESPVALGIMNVVIQMELGVLP
jgi:hypothetical protein